MQMPERDTKRVSIPHSDTHATWKRLHNDVKRTTHMFEGTFIDPFETDNASDDPLNCECCVRNTCSQGKPTKALDKSRQVATDFMKKHLIPSENNMPLKGYYDPLPKLALKE